MVQKWRKIWISVEPVNLSAVQYYKIEKYPPLSYGLFANHERRRKARVRISQSVRVESKPTLLLIHPTVVIWTHRSKYKNETLYSNYREVNQ